jgi:aspartyl-tRNA synthetase
LRKSDDGQTVTVCGWVDKYRDHAGIVFIDLRDRYGKTQVKFDLAEGSAIQQLARSLRYEDVIQVTGVVEPRPEGLANPKLATGEIEVLARDLKLLNKCQTPPFEIDGGSLANEELRLEYRFLDLRRAELQRLQILRHKLTKSTRDYFDELGFLEIETPIMGRSTPEGARDYLVPSRVHQGAFYALPQSPQLYKQILMVAGYDRYFQIARCFRDEDLRADRQPEFTQIDVEMAFVTREDIFVTIEGLIRRMVKDLRGEELGEIARLTHAEVMERFGSDKPDLRFGMELVDLGEIAAACGFSVFQQTIAAGNRVRGIRVVGAAEKYSRKAIDELTEFVKNYGAKGLAFFRVKSATELDSPIAKFFSAEDQAKLIARLGAQPGDLLFCVADTTKVSSAALGALRNRLAKELQLYDPRELKVAWVLDFPMYAWNEEEQRWEAEHHPFCQPVDEDLPLFETDPGKIRAQSYDLVCNGYEAASGSVRIYDPAVQQKVFNFIGITPDEAESRFGFLLNALRFGAPPHAGIALGLDRWVMMFGGTDNIRDVIAFPKTQKASDLMTGAPSEVDQRQLRDLHIKIDAPGQ